MRAEDWSQEIVRLDFQKHFAWRSTGMARLQSMLGSPGL